MLFRIISKDFKPDVNCISPLVQTVGGHASVNFIMAI